MKKLNFITVAKLSLFSFILFLAVSVTLDAIINGPKITF